MNHRTPLLAAVGLAALACAPRSQGPAASPDAAGQVEPAAEIAQPIDDAPRALIVVTSHGTMGETGEPTGYYLSEVVHPYFALHEAGIEVDFASPEGGKAPADPKSLKLDEDEELARFWNDASLRGRLEATVPLGQVDAGDYDAILFAGGHGTMWDFPTDANVARLGREIFESDGVVAAVCHGPAALVGITLSDGTPIVQGRDITTFSDVEEAKVELTDTVPFLLETRLREQGGQVTTAEPWQAHAVVDGRLVTGQNPASAREVGEAVAKLLTE